MELTNINNRYWIDGEEVDKDTYEYALNNLDSFVQFVGTDFYNPDSKYIEEEDGETYYGDLQCLAESLLNQNSELVKENDTLRESIKNCECNNFDIKAEFEKLNNRLDCIESRITALREVKVCSQEVAPENNNSCKEGDMECEATPKPSKKKRTSKTKNE